MGVPRQKVFENPSLQIPNSAAHSPHSSNTPFEAFYFLRCIGRVDLLVQALEKQSLLALFSLAAQSLATMATATRAFSGSGSRVRVLLLALLVSYLCLQTASADSTIANLSTRGKVYVYDKLLANGKSVTIPTAKLGNVKISRELNGAFGLIPLKDRRRYYVVNSANTGFPESDLVEGRFLTNAF